MIFGFGGGHFCTKIALTPRLPRLERRGDEVIRPAACVRNVTMEFKFVGYSSSSLRATVSPNSSSNSQVRVQDAGIFADQPDRVGSKGRQFDGVDFRVRPAQNRSSGSDGANRLENVDSSTLRENLPVSRG